MQENAWWSIRRPEIYMFLIRKNAYIFNIVPGYYFFVCYIPISHIFIYLQFTYWITKQGFMLKNEQHEMLNVRWSGDKFIVVSVPFCSFFLVLTNYLFVLVHIIGLSIFLVVTFVQHFWFGVEWLKTEIAEKQN